MRRHPITALQTEYSLWSRDAEAEVLPTVRELGIGYVAYSPLGRGFLTGQIKSPDDFADDDFRKQPPAFPGREFREEHRAGARGRDDGREKGCTTAQLALAWVLAQGEDIVPIPGTRHVKYLDDNIGALEVKLSDEDLKRLDEILPPGAAAGERYHAHGHGDGQPLAPFVDQAHAGDSGFGFLKLGDIDLGHLESAVAQPCRRFADCRRAGSADRRRGGSSPLRLGSSTASGSTPANCAGSTDARCRADRRSVGPAREGRAGLQMEAVAKLGFDDLIAERTDDGGQRSDPSASVRVDRPT